MPHGPPSTGGGLMYGGKESAGCGIHTVECRARSVLGPGPADKNL